MQNKRKINSGLLTLFITAFLAVPCISSAKSVVLDPSIDQYSIADKVEFIKDTDSRLTIDEVQSLKSWESNKLPYFNFAYIPYPVWFRVTIENPADTAQTLFLEINYPPLDTVIFYKPDGSGKYTSIETGDMRPFSSREVNDRNYMFTVNARPGISTYYLKIQSTSSMAFGINLWSVRGDHNRANKELPLYWLYYGILLIMIFYNLFVFFSVRDISYIYYILYLVFWLIHKNALDGFAFQYLWPNAIWWNTNCQTILMSAITIWHALLLRSFLHTRKNFRIIDWVVIIILLIPAVITFGLSFVAPYAKVIKIVLPLAIWSSLIQFIVSAILSIRRYRPAWFYLTGMLASLIGVMVTVLRTGGTLETTFFTIWASHIGSVLLVLLFSLGLADRINSMRKNLQVLNIEREHNEKIAKERAAHLEGIVSTANNMLREFTHVSKELNEISNVFAGLSNDQAATSEEFSATFEELTAGTENIYLYTREQELEGKVSIELIEELEKVQKSMIEETFHAAENMTEITSTSSETEERLRKMTEKMNLINAGGKEIDQFITIIDDISDKINLLSLNAAIEAARAGDYGKGFAVVADEIGKLAQATSENSKQIANKVSRIITDIEDGTNIVLKTKEATDQIFNMVNGIQASINSVTALMEEQNRSLTSVIKQAGVINTLSKEIAHTTNEQKTAMQQAQETTERLSEMAGEVTRANTKIIEFTKIILEKSEDLSDIVKGETR